MEETLEIEFAGHGTVGFIHFLELDHPARQIDAHPLVPKLLTSNSSIQEQSQKLSKIKKLPVGSS